VAGNEVHIWILEDGEHRIEKMQAFVHDVAMSPDGQFLVVADETPEATVFRLDSGARFASLRHGDGRLSDGVRSVAFDHEGRFVATAWRSTVVLWDTIEWGATRTFQFYGAVRDIALSHLADRLVAATPAALQFVELDAPGAVPVTLHPRGMQVLSFHPDGKRIAAGAGGTARIWDIESGQQLTAVTFEGDLVDIAFSPDGRSLGTSATNGIATLWDTQSGLAVAHMVHQGGAARMVFNVNGSRIATTAQDQTTMLWQPESDRAIVAARDSDYLFSADGSHLGTSSGSLELSQRRFIPAPAVGALVSGDGRLLMVNKGEAALLWNLPEGRVIANLDHSEPIDWEAIASRMRQRILRGAEHFIGNAKERGTVRALALSHDGKYAVTARIDERIRIWDVARQAILAGTVAETPFFSTGAVEYLTQAKFSRNGATLAIGRRQEIEIWRLAEHHRREVIKLKAEAADFAIDPAGSFLAVRYAGNAGTNIYSVKSRINEVAQLTNTELLIAVLFGDSRQFAPRGPERSGVSDRLGWGTNPLRAAAAVFRPGVRWLAWGKGEQAELVDLATGKVVRTFAHEAGVGSVALSNDGQFLATGHLGDIRIWNVASGVELSRITGAGGPVFSPDDTLLAGHTPEGVGVWSWRAEDVIAEVCSRVTRNLTCAEWRQYIRDRQYAATCETLPAEFCP